MVLKKTVAYHLNFKLFFEKKGGMQYKMGPKSPVLSRVIGSTSYKGDITLVTGTNL